MVDSGKTKVPVTLKVVGSQTVARPDGHVAIVLDTTLLGPIAFEVNQNAINALRRELDAAEQFLRHGAADLRQRPS